MEKRFKSKELGEIFEQILYEEKLWVNIYEFNDIELSGLETYTKVAKLNILSKRMLEYDRSFLGENATRNIEEYRPYFYNYIIYMNSKSDTKLYSRLIEMGDRWFYASFRKDMNELPYAYYGQIESSASPIIYKNKAIYISDIEVVGVDFNSNKDYKIAPAMADVQIGNKLKNLLKDIRFTSSKIFKVGNGNLINIRGYNINNLRDFEVMYDVGYHQKGHPGDERKRYGYAVRAFKRIIPDMVCLSHWDDDHIMGCVYARNELFECCWFAPQIEKKAVGARRLAAYLTMKNKLFVIERDSSSDRKLITIKNSYNEISFYMGKNVSKNGITKENCGGLLIEISDKKVEKESLFCGDVPYKSVENIIWDSRKTGYDNLLVPHHGSKMDYAPLRGKANAYAVVCGNGDQNRPNRNHRMALQRKGYTVDITEYASGHWIDLKLN